jgi:hypothetical protein
MYTVRLEIWKLLGDAGKIKKSQGAVSCLKSLVYYAKIALPNRICSIDESKKESCSSNIRRR